MNVRVVLAAALLAPALVALAAPVSATGELTVVRPAVGPAKGLRRSKGPR